MDNLFQDQTTHHLLDNGIGEIDQSVAELNKVITTAASTCLTRVKYVKRSIKEHRNKKWYTLACEMLCREVKKLSKALGNTPKRNNIRENV